MKLASTIDHTLLKPDSRLEDIRRLCEEAKEHEFAAVCVPSYYVGHAARFLEDSICKVATVVGFPYGYSNISAKVEEVKRAISEGADEIDAVVNICAIKDGNWSHVKNDIESITIATHLKGKVLKVIFETGLLTEEEILKLCTICTDLKVNFVKTSTGVSSTGATVETVQLLRANLPSDIKIKASGGIRSAEQAQNLIEAGAARIGTSSGVTIVQGVMDVE